MCIRDRNIRRIRKEKGIRQTEMVALLQLENVMITREALVKIERGIQHIQATPVSYTHLDVYKRQLVVFMLFPMVPSRFWDDLLLIMSKSDVL